MNDSSTKFCLACFIAFAVAACVWCMFYYEIPPGSKEAMLVLLGYLSAAFQSVYQFYFGSSSGSERKTEIMNRPGVPAKGDCLTEDEAKGEDNAKV